MNGSKIVDYAFEDKLCLIAKEKKGEFITRVGGFLEDGLTEPRTRFEAELMLIFHFWSRGLDQDAVFRKVKEWYLTKTNGMSKDWNSVPSRVLANLNRTIHAHFEWASTNLPPSKGDLSKTTINS